MRGYTYFQLRILTCSWVHDLVDHRNHSVYLLREHPISNGHKRFDPCFALTGFDGFGTVFTSIRWQLLVRHHRGEPACSSSLTSWIFCTDDQHIGLNPKTTQFFHRVLGRRNHFSRSLQIGRKSCGWPRVLLPTSAYIWRKSFRRDPMSTVPKLLYWWHLNPSSSCSIFSFKASVIWGITCTVLSILHDVCCEGLRYKFSLFVTFESLVSNWYQ